MHGERLHQIIAFLLREGRAFAHFRALGAQQSAKRADIAARLAHALIDLGPTFVKLGQILSTCPDLVPPEYIAALERRQDNVPPVAGPQVNAIVKRALGRDVPEVFASDTTCCTGVRENYGF